MGLNHQLIESLKKELKLEKDKDLADIFNISPSVFSSWKRSKGKLLEEIVRYGIKNQLDFNRVFHNEAKFEFLNGERRRTIEKELGTNGSVEEKVSLGLSRRFTLLPLVLYEDMFSLVVDYDANLSRLKKIIFPKFDDSTMVFDINRMLIFVSNYDIRLLEKDVLCIVLLRNRGLFYGSFVKMDTDLWTFKEGTYMYSVLNFRRDEVVRLFKVNSILSRTEYF